MALFDIQTRQHDNYQKLIKRYVNNFWNGVLKMLKMCCAMPVHVLQMMLLNFELNFPHESFHCLQYLHQNHCVWRDWNTNKKPKRTEHPFGNKYLSLLWHLSIFHQCSLVFSLLLSFLLTWEKRTNCFHTLNSWKCSLFNDQCSFNRWKRTIEIWKRCNFFFSFCSLEWDLQLLTKINRDEWQRETL